MQFKQAKKEKLKARIGLIGVSGSGKTYTALTLATCIGKKVAVIDSEHGSASKYADLFNFDVLELDSFSPENYIKAVQAANQAGYEVLIVDSLSHAWNGPDGALELADRNSARYGGNKFAGWRDVTPLHNKMMDTLLTCPMHLIVTLRAKTEYIQTQDDRGKSIVRKVGMAPVQRDGVEFEFDIVGEMDVDHNLIITKTRYNVLDGKVINKPGEQLALAVLTWLNGEAQKVDKPKAPALPAATESNASSQLKNSRSLESRQDIQNSQSKLLNWQTFWTKALKEYGLSRVDVNELACAFYQEEGIKSLNDKIKDQVEMNAFLEYLEGFKRQSAS